MGTSIDAGDAYILDTHDVIQHEADWRQVLEHIKRLTALYATSSHANQTNLELPAQYKEECLELARRLGLIGVEGSVSLAESRQASAALQSQRGASMMDTLPPQGVNPVDTGGAAASAYSSRGVDPVDTG